MANNRAAWVAALRSGEYTQGRHALQRNRGGVSLYCCLGVACEVAMGAGIELEYDSSVEHRNRGVGTYQAKGFSNSETLPSSVQAWLGMTSDDGRFEMEGAAFRSFLRGVGVVGGDIEPGASRSLVSLNDAGVSFEDIATFIESMPDDMFEEG